MQQKKIGLPKIARKFVLTMVVIVITVVMIIIINS